MVSSLGEPLSQYLAYFEEPEPGVPVGYSGWYHSHGQFQLRSPKQVFDHPDRSGTPVRPEVAGPFVAQEEALISLRASMESAQPQA